MGILTDKPQDTEIDSKITAKLDRIDLNNEMAGIDTGKSWRFLSSNSPSHPQVRKKLETEREFRSMLDMLLTQDPHYAALYKKVTEKVEKAQQAVDLALVDINKRLEASDRKFQVLRENAVQLQDGTKVFQSNLYRTR
jgi:Asp-tRNA(Asn)/Glu-tRNA(Gln) amidotransferase B subunit